MYSGKIALDRIFKSLQFAAICIAVWLLVKLTEWVSNDLITFRFESSSLNDIMLGTLSMLILFGVPIIVAEIYEKWKFLDRIYWEDKRSQELTRTEILNNKNGLADKTTLTKSERILQALSPEGQTRTRHVMEAYDKRVIDQSMSENHKGVLKEREEQLKNPLDVEQAVKRQRHNAKDHPQNP